MLSFFTCEMYCRIVILSLRGHGESWPSTVSSAGEVMDLFL